jgi:hypothetical protein
MLMVGVSIPGERDAVPVIELSEGSGGGDEVDVGAGECVAGAGSGNAEILSRGSAVNVLDGEGPCAAGLVGDFESGVGDGGADADTEGVVDLGDDVVERDIVGGIDDGGVAGAVRDAELSA